MVTLMVALALIFVYLIFDIVVASKNVPGYVRTMNNLMERKTRACYKSTNRQLCNQATRELEEFTERMKRKTAKGN